MVDIASWAKVKGLSLFSGFKRKRGSCDQMTLDLPEFSMTMTREVRGDEPYELTVVVPRAEVRKSIRSTDPDVMEIKYIYSSVTMVHAPRLPKSTKPVTDIIKASSESTGQMTSPSKEKITDQDKATEHERIYKLQGGVGTRLHITEKGPGKPR